MEFSNWQIDRLRSGLNSYRILHSWNGIPPSWRAVSEAVMKCPKTSSVFPTDGSLGEVRGEALRRFVAGIAKSEQFLLDDIASFLIHEGELEPEELERGERSSRSLLQR